MNVVDFESRAYYVGSLIKLVAREDIDCICSVAKEVADKYSDVEDCENMEAYEKYCDCMMEE